MVFGSNFTLTFITLWANSADDEFIIFFSYFPQKQGFDISCKLSPLETICIKCQTCFLGKIGKDILKCRLQKNLPSMLSRTQNDLVKYNTRIKQLHYVNPRKSEKTKWTMSRRKKNTRILDLPNIFPPVTVWLYESNPLLLHVVNSKFFCSFFYCFFFFVCLFVFFCFFFFFFCFFFFFFVCFFFLFFCFFFFCCFFFVLFFFVCVCVFFFFFFVCVCVCVCFFFCFCFYVFFFFLFVFLFQRKQVSFYLNFLSLADLVNTVTVRKI